MSQTNITIRMDRELKQEAEKLFNELGLNMTTALTMFTKAAVREQRIPLSFHFPTSTAKRYLLSAKLKKAKICMDLLKQWKNWWKV